MKVSKGKSKVLLLGWDNPMPQDRLHFSWTESSSAGNNSGVLVRKKLNMSQQCAFEATKAVATWAI